MAEERTTTSLEDIEKLLAAMDKDLAEMDKAVAELAEEFVLEEEELEELLAEMDESLKAHKEKIRVSGGYFQVLASYNQEEFEWIEYYSCQKAAEDDVQIRVNCMREYDHTPLQVDKLECVVEPY